MENHYTRAVPILEKYNFKGTFYVITQMPKYMLEEGEGRMSHEEWIDLSKRGHEIGAHSQTHPNFNVSFPHRIKKEVSESKRDLEKIGIHVETFAYPYGNRGFFSEYFLRHAGYLGARIYDDTSTTPIRNKYALSTKNVYNDTSIEEIKKWIDSCTQDTTWTILTLHQVEPNPQKWGCTPEIFEKICEYVHNKDIKVGTVSECLKLF